MAPLVLRIKPINGNESFSVTVDDSAGVNELKATIAALRGGLPDYEPRLIHKGKILEDDTPLSMYGAYVLTDLSAIFALLG
eukprot:43970-Eustigmatos_ZCMA.PRE.1